MIFPVSRSEPLKSAYSNYSTTLAIIVLVEFRFTTSKTKCDIQYTKLRIWVISRVAKRFKTQIWVFSNWRHFRCWADFHAHTRKKKRFKFRWRHCAHSPFQKLNFGNSSQKHAAVDIKLFLYCPVLRDFSNLFQIFYPTM